MDYLQSGAERIFLSRVHRVFAHGGALVNLSLFNKVMPAADGKSVVIETGVSGKMYIRRSKREGLAVVGKRNSQVGVGGLTLGGDLSFFSPQFGVVCSNIIEYEVVLADGEVAKASATKNPDLWRALKGGANDFGVVTRFTTHAFPSAKIWSGFLYLHSSQASKVLTALHEVRDRVIATDQGKVYNEFAAGPIACFTYLQQLGIQGPISVALTRTKLPEHDKKWPTCWQTSSFAPLWRFWSTCSAKSLTAAVEEMSVLNPPGWRLEFATIVPRLLRIVNDQGTLDATHRAYHDAVAQIRETKIEDQEYAMDPRSPASAARVGAQRRSQRAGT
jgi:hypothetical protein